MAEPRRRPASGRSRGPAPAARKRAPVKRPAQKVVRGPARSGPAAPAKEAKSGGTSSAVAASIERSAEHQSEQRLGSTARRAAVLAAVVCALTLTVAGPVRTYFSQQAEKSQLAAAEAQLRDQIASLEDKKRRLADPAYIAAQARERLGFVMPGEVPFQVQLPNTPVDAKPQSQGPVDNGNPWYTNLWHNIADSPTAIPTAPPEVPPAPPAPRP
ncbi:septum formation initiator [Mycobacteroides immunogenum]|uniref:Septum formation initiator n=1 Tax=Mycobacteroides immunogenum TaxID=83262 RepID=A0A179V907_9MYCO|nr:septum formation initiator family protein [Mycobacteroides immunogenum]OAT68390.1 septum formation initiator [Mycobacteroides immunogenum]